VPEWQVSAVPQGVPIITSLHADVLTEGWQLWQAFAGFATPLAMGVPPMTHPAPESGAIASDAASAPPLEPEPLDPELLPLSDPELVELPPATLPDDPVSPPWTAGVRASATRRKGEGGDRYGESARRSPRYHDPSLKCRPDRPAPRCPAQAGTTSNQPPDDDRCNGDGGERFDVVHFGGHAPGATRARMMSSVQPSLVFFGVFV
jgi:hypothetical protein